jgi:hypothetical protein
MPVGRVPTVRNEDAKASFTWPRPPVGILRRDDHSGMEQTTVDIDMTMPGVVQLLNAR